jgi:hypothetical protein
VTPDDLGIADEETAAEAARDAEQEDWDEAHFDTPWWLTRDTFDDYDYDAGEDL